MKAKNLAVVLTLPLILLFTYTAVSKVLEHEKFVFQMRLSPLPIMGILAPALSWLVPVAEVVIVGLLLLPRWRKLGFIVSMLLLGMFELYIGAMIVWATDLPCTCGGIISKMSWHTHLVFNAVFILLAVLGLVSENGRWPLTGIPESENHLPSANI